MIAEHTRSLDKEQFEAELEQQGLTGHDGAMVALFGDDGRSDLCVRYRWSQGKRELLIHRLNTLWVYPAFILLIPARYLMFGQYGVDKDSRFGKMLTYLLGDYN